MLSIPSGHAVANNPGYEVVEGKDYDEQEYVLCVNRSTGDVIHLTAQYVVTGHD